MDMLDFYDRIEAHPELEGVGVNLRVEKPGLVVKHGRSGLMTLLPLETVKGQEWPVLEAILVGRRDACPLDHMSRVVGYFSRIENWNKSKLGELKDRHKGDYACLEDLEQANVPERPAVEAGMSR
ncbi:MAG: anaerobic ribonucleoside-triphosphate reductase [Planctomycetota bacterium]|jgi:hypothetical protein|nr:anaerobic ribonucleoside-triphosphate reductase [Planctomycetota bacterium]